jgi:hypothetical protein
MDESLQIRVNLDSNGSIVFQDGYLRGAYGEGHDISINDNVISTKKTTIFEFSCIIVPTGWVPGTLPNTIEQSVDTPGILGSDFPIVDALIINSDDSKFVTIVREIEISDDCVKFSLGMDIIFPDPITMRLFILRTI